MLTSRECLDRLLQRHPDFAPAWEQHLAYWEGSGRGDYIDASCFVDWLFGAVSRDDQPVLVAASESIEFLLDHGDAGLTELVVVGILESLTNRCSHHPESSPFSRIARHLGPRAYRACRDLDQGWGTRTKGIDET